MKIEKIIEHGINLRLRELVKEVNRNEEKINYKEIIEKAYQDLKAFSEKDPSSKKNMEYILNSYLSYLGVLGYRLANYIYNLGDIEIARKISESIKIKTGIEIHPAATIGKRFILDHGTGTVIGETVKIGDDCYILQNVILGSTNISSNKNGIRHPQIGNNVEIGGFARLYGDITIGNNVKISPGAIIKKSIPSDAKIIVSSNYQVLRSKKDFDLFFSGYFYDKNKLIVLFNNGNLKKFKQIQAFNQEKNIEKMRIKEKALIFDEIEAGLGSFNIIFEQETEIMLNLI